MKCRYVLGLSGLAALVSCGPERQPQPPVTNRDSPVLPAPSAPPAVANSEAPAIPPPGTGPDARTPLSEPKDAIDPKSVEAAGQVIQHYGALIEQRRWREGWTLWTSADAAKTFERNFRTWSEVHLEVGKPGDMEGAAGSIYVTVPVVFYGMKNGGGDMREHAQAILRRVNDVPGSTEEQRRWHIERIDWGS